MGSLDEVLRMARPYAGTVAVRSLSKTCYGRVSNANGNDDGTGGQEGILS